MSKSFISPTSPEIFNIKKLHRKSLVQGSVGWGRVIDKKSIQTSAIGRNSKPNQNVQQNRGRDNLGH